VHRRVLEGREDAVKVDVAVDLIQAILVGRQGPGRISQPDAICVDGRFEGHVVCLIGVPDIGVAQEGVDLGQVGAGLLERLGLVFGLHAGDQRPRNEVGDDKEQGHARAYCDRQPQPNCRPSRKSTSGGGRRGGS